MAVRCEVRYTVYRVVLDSQRPYSEFNVPSFDLRCAKPRAILIIPVFIRTRRILSVPNSVVCTRITLTLEPHVGWQRFLLAKKEMQKIQVSASHHSSLPVRPFVPEDTDRLRRDTLISQMHEMEDGGGGDATRRRHKQARRKKRRSGAARRGARSSETTRWSCSLAQRAARSESGLDFRAVSRTSPSDEGNARATRESRCTGPTLAIEARKRLSVYRNSGKNLCRARLASGCDATHYVDSVGTQRRAGESFIVRARLILHHRQFRRGLAWLTGNSSPGFATEHEWKGTNVVRPRGVGKPSQCSRDKERFQRNVAASPLRIAKNKRLSKRRGTTVREGDAIQHDAMLEETYEAGGTRIATTEKGTRRRRPVEEEGQVRRRTKAENDGLQKDDRKKERGRERTKRERRGKEKEKERRRRTKSVCKRANYELVRRRPLRIATNKRPALFVVLPRRPRDDRSNDRRYTPSRDFSAGGVDEESSPLFPDFPPSLLLPPMPLPFFTPRFANGFFVEIRLAFDLDGRERRTNVVILVRFRRRAPRRAAPSGSTGFSKGGTLRVCAPPPRRPRASANQMPIVPRSLSSFHHAPHLRAPSQCFRRQLIAPLFAASR
ncbi:hypothetical protein DBV15_08306 [Temnothorax longispinosus]|uniref:Uncharacterized protein n=1 Tax=Temnothorax longispinosus TaxID=300112 RepID=A0A4S2KLL9_9HYME|nr:hypothetical protein DBV15_08306 [Temnothorax longispinosus]